MSPGGRDGFWPAIVAAVLTCVSFGSLLVSIRESHARARFASSTALRPPTEAVVFFTPREPVRNPTAGEPSRPIRPARARARSADSAARSAATLPLEADPAQRVTATSPLTAEASRESVSTLSFSTRLSRPRQHEEPWYVAPRGPNLFKPAEPLTGPERDSVLRILGSDVPGLAARRGQTTSERDARAKEAMLKMRLTGRVLLVPPDNSGGLITSSLPLPLFGARPPSATRARATRADDDNRARLERLRQRADSLRRSRADSLPQ